MRNEKRIMEKGRVGMGEMMEIGCRAIAKPLQAVSPIKLRANFGSSSRVVCLLTSLSARHRNKRTKGDN